MHEENNSEVRKTFDPLVVHDYTTILANYNSNPNRADVKLTLRAFLHLIWIVAGQANIAEIHIFLITRRLKSNLVTYQNVRKNGVPGSQLLTNTKPTILTDIELRNLTPRAAVP
jgi:hypothetical protein